MRVEIVDFLSACLDEDEVAALATTPTPVPGRWRASRDKHAPDSAPLYLVRGEDPDDFEYEGYSATEIIAFAADWQTEAEANLRHIARHDPARVLAEVAAKRAILAEAMSWDHNYVDGDTWLSCAQATSPFAEDGAPGSGCADKDRAGGPCDCGLDRRRATFLRALAAPYADRPGYKPAWTVEQ